MPILSILNLMFLISVKMLTSNIWIDIVGDFFKQEMLSIEGT